MTFYTVALRVQNNPQLIISDLKNKFFTIFGNTNNLDAVYIGDASISYNLKKGFPVGAISNTIGLEYIKKVYVTDSNHWYMSGLENDQLYVLVEDNPFDVWGNLITSLLSQLLAKN